MSLGTLSNVNVDVTDIKMATGSWYFLSFSALIRQIRTAIRTAGVKTKAFKFTVWDRSFPFISETSNFFHDVQDVSAFFASARYFWLRAVPFQSVESRLGRTGESEIAKRRTGEREAPLQFSLGWPCFFRSHRSIFSLARPPWGTARSLMWLKRSKSTSTSMITFP